MSWAEAKYILSKIPIEVSKSTELISGILPRDCIEKTVSLSAAADPVTDKLVVDLRGCGFISDISVSSSVGFDHKDGGASQQNLVSTMDLVLNIDGIMYAFSTNANLSAFGYRGSAASSIKISTDVNAIISGGSIKAIPRSESANKEITQVSNRPLIFKETLKIIVTHSGSQSISNSNFSSYRRSSFTVKYAIAS